MWAGDAPHTTYVGGVRELTIERVDISVRGRSIGVSGVRVGERSLIVSSGWLKTAEVLDEAWLARDAIPAPDVCVAALRHSKLNADLFTFAQKLPDVTPQYPYVMEWDNVAAIPTSNFASWWERRIPQETRKNVRRASKRGVVVRDVGLNGELLHGIVEINNETPVRQGRRFWHYGKSLAEVQKDYATLVDQSVYLGAYHEAELIGFIKMVYMGEVAGILQLLCKPSHYDKRPANALLARAVEICSSKGITYLTYGQYSYGNKRQSPLMEFKRRNGFEQWQCPRYYMPLTFKGRMALAIGVHHGWRRLVPEPVGDVALRIRSAWYRRSSGVTTEDRQAAVADRGRADA